MGATLFILPLSIMVRILKASLSFLSWVSYRTQASLQIFPRTLPPSLPQSSSVTSFATSMFIYQRWHFFIIKYPSLSYTLSSKFRHLWLVHNESKVKNAHSQVLSQWKYPFSMLSRQYCYKKKSPFQLLSKVRFKKMLIWSNITS